MPIPGRAAAMRFTVLLVGLLTCQTIRTPGTLNAPTHYTRSSLCVLETPQYDICHESNRVYLASSQTGRRHPPKSYQNPHTLQAEVHSLGVHSLTQISSGCSTLLCSLNHSNLTFKHSKFTFKNLCAL